MFDLYVYWCLCDCVCVCMGVVGYWCCLVCYCVLDYCVELCIVVDGCYCLGGC